MEIRVRCSAVATQELTPGLVFFVFADYPIFNRNTPFKGLECKWELQAREVRKFWSLLRCKVE